MVKVLREDILVTECLLFALYALSSVGYNLAFITQIRVILGEVAFSVVSCGKYVLRKYMYLFFVCLFDEVVILENL